VEKQDEKAPWMLPVNFTDGSILDRTSPANETAREHDFVPRVFGFSLQQPNCPERRRFFNAQ